jgi:hypothetical protein
VAAREIVDRLEIEGADAVGDGTDMRIIGDAAIEDRLGARPVAVADFADQFDADLDGVLAIAVPGEVRFADGIDQPDGACRDEIDGDHLADRPLAGDCPVGIVGVGADDGARPVAMHDIAENALVDLSLDAPFLRCGFPAGGYTFDKHVGLPSSPEAQTLRGSG